MKRLFTLVLLVGSTALAVIGAETTTNLATAVGDPRLRVFARQKRKQMEEFAAKLHLDVPSEAREFFQAAEAGDWKAVSNRFERIRYTTSRTETNPPLPNLNNVLYFPIHETLGAYDVFQRFDETMLQKFADGILRSIPPGSIYFGGTDPGRFVITVVRDTAQSPDIFVLTQNALADNRYMDYLRLTYGERLSLPATNEVKAAFQQYVNELKTRTPSPDEQVTYDKDGRINVRGVGGVMAVNGILAKWIFDHNKDKHEFYVEESYVIPWMYPYMEPHRLILKLNKEPMRELDPAVVAQDRKFWGALAKDLLSDPRFRDNEAASKTFSKLRSSIGSLYSYWHLTTEAEAALKQAQELYPISPEANFRLAQLYMEQNRFDDAIAVIKVLQQLDPSNKRLPGAIEQLREAKRRAEEKKPPTNPP